MNRIKFELEMKRHIMTCVAVLAGMLYAQAESVSAGAVVMEKGQTATTTISLTNSNANLVSFQMDLVLPEGVTINKTGCSLTSRFDNDQELTIGKQSDGSYRLTSTSFSLTPISGTSGAIITLSLTASQTAMATTATIRNIRFGTGNSERITCSDVTFGITVNGDQPDREYTDAQGVKYTLNDEDNIATVSGYTDVCSGTVTIPATVNGYSVTSIGNGAFNGFTGMTSVTIPNSVTSIGDRAFVECSGLTDVYSYAVNVPTAGANAFQGFNIGNATLHVPVNYVDAYKAATGWKDFKEIVGLTGSVKLSKTKANIEKGKTLTLKATVSPSTLLDKSVTWKSSSTKIAKVSSSGKVTGVGAGTATITCTHVATGAKATCKVTIGYVTLDKTVVSVKKGKTVTLTPTVYPSTLTDMSVTWKSSDTGIATVSSSGKVKGVKYGQATITCTSVATGLSTTCLVTVGSIILDESVLTLEKGKTFTLEPTVYPSTLEDKSVTWKSSDTGIATVSSSGKVKGVKAGTATITCTSVTTGLSATCEVTVSYVKLDKTTASVNTGKTLTLKATVYPSTLDDRSVTWKSSNTKIATVSTSGKVKGVKAGTATITCTSNATGLSASCKVTVGSVSLDKTTLTLQKGKTSTLTATVAPSTLADQSVTWKSSDTGIATVSSSGKVKGVKYGTATITCTSNATGLSTSCEVTVVYVKLSKTTVGLEKGKTLTLKATVYPSTLEDRSVTWKSSDTKIATVSSSGKVTGVGYGTATITCTSKATGIKATCKVTVGKVVLSMSDFSIKKNGAVTLEATVYPSTLADQSVTWESSDTKIATVSSTGRIKGIKAGTATITCTSNATGLSATCKITVTASLGTRSIEGDDDELTGIDELNVESTEVQPYDVYDLSGRKVAHQVTTLDGLPNGIYIVNGKKVLKK